MDQTIKEIKAMQKWSRIDSTISYLFSPPPPPTTTTTRTKSTSIIIRSCVQVKQLQRTISMADARVTFTEDHIIRTFLIPKHQSWFIPLVIQTLTLSGKREEQVFLVLPLSTQRRINTVSFPISNRRHHTNQAPLVNYLLVFKNQNFPVYYSSFLKGNAQSEDCLYYPKNFRLYTIKDSIYYLRYRRY